MRGASLAAAASAALFASSCAERGDFGRPKETALSAFFAPVLGPTESRFPFTDDEKELRARAWRFLTPAKERSAFDGLLHDMADRGFIEGDHFPETLTWYKEALLADVFRSPSSRFSRIGEDVSIDRALIVPFAAAAARVTTADRLRIKAMRHVRDLDKAEIEDARIRVRENVALIGWVCHRVAMRVLSYRHAVEHLFVAMPQEDAVNAERAVIALDREFSILRATGCVRPDPFRDIALHRGLRIPPDGHFWSEDSLGPPVIVEPPPLKIVKR